MTLKERCYYSNLRTFNYVKAGLVEADEYWLVKKAIYGLKEPPLLWSKERDRKLAKIVIEIEKIGIKEQYILKKLK